ncbi:Pleckstrin domain-containing protein [Cinnamomum micranthum f. kanehirae]|uniref:Pleckstrin domain-containing protein n=1 Tax=Cinnamomum micranthum f. kanehirae TaxID=337451 RepID=A0A443Q0X8_9MAGN|nr:Pleckstrin domain-containing protein [Cinnamomum micranthum f. kanehirae]
MGIPQNTWRMESWLYVIESNRLGLQYTRKRYFVFEDDFLNCFKSMPASKEEGPIRSAPIDSCICVTDYGIESIKGKDFFIFSLYNVSNHDDRLKLGARSSEEAAKWVLGFKEAALKGCSNPERHSVRLKGDKRTSHTSSLGLADWATCSSPRTDKVMSDVVASCPWTIFGCENGLRLFKGAKDGDFHEKSWDNHSATMAVGVVDAPSESVFQIVMSLGPSRSEWDFCFHQGRVVEHVDGHTDIIHMQLNSNWLPWGMKRRDLLLRRYWRKEDDGTYVILYQSVFHQKCLPEGGYVRAFLKAGGYVISPVHQGKQSVVKHVLSVDWKCWNSCLISSSARSVTIRRLRILAALRELLKTKLGNHSNFSFGELEKEIDLPHIEKEHIKEVYSTPEPRFEAQNSSREPAYLDRSFLHLSDVADEFFDVPEQSEYELLESSFSSDSGNEIHNQDLCHPNLSTAADFVKKIHELSVQMKGYVNIQDAAMEDSVPCRYGTTLPKDPSCTLPCSWTTSDPSTYLIRGENYLRDHQKVKAKNTIMQLVAVDWLNSDKREDDLGGRPGSIVQKYAAQGGNEFFFIINLQVPGAVTYNLALYYMLDAPIESVPQLNSFVEGDDAYRNSRFKLIPHIAKGSWIVKQSVGKKACLLGRALEINYFRGKNYLELGVDVGSSSVARSVVSLVLGYLNNLVIEMAFLIQANTLEEFPECLIGTCCLNHLDASKSVSIRS